MKSDAPIRELVLGLVISLAAVHASTGCCFGGWGPAPALVDAGVPTAPVSAQPIETLVPAVEGCVASESARVDEGIEALCAAPTRAPRARLRRAFSCTDAVVLHLFDYGDEASARRAALHLAARLWQGSAPTSARPAEVLRRLGVLAVVTGGEWGVPRVAGPLVRELGFVAALPGRTRLDAPRAGMGAPFGGALSAHAPSSFNEVNAQVSFRCAEAPGPACEAIASYPHLHAEDPPREAPRVLFGKCWARTQPATQTPCWLLWGRLGIDLGELAPHDQENDQTTRELAILERGPGFTAVYEGLGFSAWLGEERGWLLVRGDAAHLVAVEMSDRHEVRRLGVFEHPVEAGE